MDLSLLRAGTVVVMKKTHPCGGVKWQIVRTGADYKLKCCTCGRTLMFTPDELASRIKKVGEDLT